MTGLTHVRAHRARDVTDVSPLWRVSSGGGEAMAAAVTTDRCRTRATARPVRAADRAAAARHHLRPRGRRARRRADAAAAPRLGRERRPQLVPGLRAARRALPLVAPDLRGHARGLRSRARLPARRLRRRLRGDARRTRTPARSSRSATRWAARSRSCSGAATATSSTASCCARPPPASSPTALPRLRVPGVDARLRPRPRAPRRSRASAAVGAERRVAPQRTRRRGPRPRCAATTGA